MKNQITRVEFTQELTPEQKVIKAWYSYLKKRIEHFKIAKFLSEDSSCIWYDEFGYSYNARLVIVCNINNYFKLGDQFRYKIKIEIIKPLNGGAFKRGYIVYIGAMLEKLSFLEKSFPQLNFLWKEESKLQSVVKV